MTKIIEMKKDAFLKKVNDYAARKKESPTKLYITPASLAAIKVKFIFARTYEITLKPEDLSFFKKSLMIRTTPVQATEADAGKTYYFSFCAPLMKELTKARIYAGRNAEEKLEALSLYLNTVKDGKIIFEVISKIDINTTDVTPRRNEGERSASFTVEEGSSCSQSFIADASVRDASIRDASVRDASVTDASIENRSVEDASVENASDQSSVTGSNREAEEERRVSREVALLDLLEEGRRQVESQELTIQGLKDRILLYENLAVQSDLKIRESKTKARESRRKTRERDLTINNLGQTLQTLQAENEQLRVQQAEALLQAQTLQAQALQAETARSVALEAEAARSVALQAASVQATPLQVSQNEEAQNNEEEDEEARDEDIDNLIAAFDDQEIDASLHLSETIAQWNDRLLQSRNESVTVRIFNNNNNRDEEQTLARFIAIAKLEREKAAHLATSGNPWPKEAALATLQSDGYSDDLHCFSLYQSFPEELKKFVVLFAFWEAAHHNRFYRNALSTVLNGGQVPGYVGMSGSDPTDTMLKLLHYTDMTRILMGHYGYIAWNKFNMNMFFTQDENEARFQTGVPRTSVSQTSVPQASLPRTSLPQTAAPDGTAGGGIDISRTTTESALYM